MHSIHKEIEPMSSETEQPVPATPVPTAALAQPAAVPVAPAATEQPRISIDDFLKIDLRVARILTAERVPKSKKLMKLEVDLGFERRTLVAGIAEAYAPEALVGRVVAVVANLQPATLMGVESNGMVMAASQPGGLPILVGFEREPELGSRVK
jgi:methionyl-tRNA synthetase